jgi:capsular exopolysaccharide synthesis family protein
MGPGWARVDFGAWVSDYIMEYGSLTNFNSLVNSQSMNFGNEHEISKGPGRDYQDPLDSGIGRFRPLGRPFDAREEKTLIDYLALVLEHAWIVALSIGVITVLSIIYAISQTPVYKSEAVLEVVQPGEDALKKIGGAGGGMPMLNPSEAYATQIELLQSRWLAEELVDRMAPKERSEFSPENKKSIFAKILDLTNLLNRDSDTNARPAKGPIVKEIMSRVTARRKPDTRLIELEITASHPDLAHKLLNEYINIYLSENLEQRRQYALDGLKWLNNELARVEKRLVKSLAELVEFTNKHGLVSLDEENNHVVNFFNQAAEDLVDAQAERVQLEAYSKGRGPDTPMDAPESARSQEIQALKDRLTKLESEYAELSQIYAEDYPKLTLLKKQISFQRKRLENVRNEAVEEALQSARQREELNRAAFEEAKQDAMSLNSHGVQRAILKKEVETNDEIYKILLEKSKTMALNSQIIGNDIRLIDQPTKPRSPIRPRKSLIIGFGVMFGLFFGIGLAVLMGSFDDKIRFSTDIEEKIGLEALGLVPDNLRFSREFPAIEPFEFTAIRAPRAPVTESVRTIKNRLFMPLSAASVRTVIFTSSGPSEGKTFMAVSMAMILAAEDEKRVLLVDADLRRPRIGKLFRQEQNAPGLSSVLSGQNLDLNRIIRRCRESGLYYTPSGPIPSNPAGLLGSHRMADFLRKAREKFDMVIIDCPPTLGFSDSHIVASLADGVVLLAKQGEAPIPALMEARDQLMSAKGRILGVVITMAERLNPSYGKYGKYKYYNKYYRSRQP